MRKISFATLFLLGALAAPGCLALSFGGGDRDRDRDESQHAKLEKRVTMLEKHAKHECTAACPICKAAPQE